MVSTGVFAAKTTVTLGSCSILLLDRTRPFHKNLSCRGAIEIIERVSVPAAITFAAGSEGILWVTHDVCRHQTHAGGFADHIILRECVPPARQQLASLGLPY